MLLRIDYQLFLAKYFIALALPSLFFLLLFSFGALFKYYFSLFTTFFLIAPLLIKTFSLLNDKITVSIVTIIRLLHNIGLQKLYTYPRIFHDIHYKVSIRFHLLEHHHNKNHHSIRTMMLQHKWIFLLA